jgi:GNAT superfamily N-acetyltransferase
LDAAIDPYDQISVYDRISVRALSALCPLPSHERSLRAMTSDRGIGLDAESTMASVQISPPNYPSDLERKVVLSDGTRCDLRPIRPDDAELLVDFHEHLSSRSSYLRFFTFHPTLSVGEVERFTSVDYLDRLAFVVEVDGELVAVGRFDRHVGTPEAEVAFVVADDYQYHGLGSLLLDELAQAARDRGITTFLADTLSENHAMLGVFRHSGFEISSNTEYGTVALRFGIGLTESYRVALAQRDQARQMTPCRLIGRDKGAAEC